MSDRLRRERHKPPKPPGSPFSYGNAWGRQAGSWAGSISFDNSFRLALGIGVTTGTWLVLALGFAQFG